MDRLTSFGSLRAIDSDNLTVEAIVSTEQVARDGAVILASAWRTHNYSKNPVILLHHRIDEMPVARALSTRVENRELRQTIQFDRDDPRSVDVFNKVRKGHLSSLSVRWSPIAWEKRHMNGREVLHFTDVDLLEVSFVSVPSDPGAVVIRTESGELVNARSFPDMKKTVAATDYVVSPLERAWTEIDMSVAERDATMRANTELASILVGASVANARAGQGTGFRWPERGFERLRAAYLSLVMPDAPTVLSGGTERAMDAQETGYGLELVGASFESEMWRASRSRDLLLNSIPIVRAPKGEHTIATDGELPEMLLVAENTDSTVGTKYTTSKMPTASKNGDGKKFTIQTMFSGELNEDSIVAFVPMLRETLTESFRKHLASCYLNGDTTNAGTGNINLNDADPGDTKHYLAFDGIRHAYLVDATGQAVNHAGAAATLGLIDDLRDLLSGDVGSKVDTLSTIDHGAEPADLLLICDRWTLRSIATNISQFTSIERLTRGDIRAGEQGRIGGIRCYAPSYAVRTGTNGLIVNAGGGTSGQISLINTRSWKGVQTGGVKILVDRIQGRDQHLAELYTRQQLHRFSDTAVAGAYNVAT